jgi:hypothetical protein
LIKVSEQFLLLFSQANRYLVSGIILLRDAAANVFLSSSSAFFLSSIKNFLPPVS